MTPSILLLQARRPDDPVLEDEVDAFRAKLGATPLRLLTHNLVEGPPSRAAVLSHDAVLVGGSGEFYVSKGNLPGLEGTLELMREIAAAGPPMLASCFGFQCLVAALGGEVVYDRARSELGTYDLQLTEEGARDPLFGALPRCFRAQMGHQDRAARLPAGVPNLAASARCELQALRLPGRPVWASQFHPELDPVENRGRYERYLDEYSRHFSPEERAAALERFRGPSHTEILPRLFLRLVLD